VSDLNVIRQLARAGIIFPDTVRDVTISAADYANDAVSLLPTLVTTPNSGVPAWLTTWFDPNAIDIVLAPMAASQIATEVKKGDWTTTTAMFRTREPVGQVATYGDWSPNGMSSANTNYPSRETYAYQTWIEYGERELAQASAGMIDVAGDKQYAKSLVMAKFANKSYLFGVAGFKNYGLTNDPNLPATVAAPVNYATATPEAIANDVVRMVGLLITQSAGLINGSERLVFAAAPSAINDIRRTNEFGLSAEKKIRESYPNIVYVPVPEYDTAGGRLVQLWAAELEGQPTVELGFTEKLRAGRMEIYSTYSRQKFMAGTLGAVVYLPFAVTQTLGV
jgi:hypothetical protein